MTFETDVLWHFFGQSWSTLTLCLGLLFSHGRKKTCILSRLGAFSQGDILYHLLISISLLHFLNMEENLQGPSKMSTTSIPQRIKDV